MSGFARLVRLNELGGQPVTRRFGADAAEREAIRARLGLLALDRLEADLSLHRVPGGVAVAGTVLGAVRQACVLSGQPVVTEVSEGVAVRYLVDVAPAGEEVELAEPDLDTLPLEGGSIDLGELAVQTLALALPAFPRAEGPEVEAARALLLSEEEAAALAQADRRAASAFAPLAGSG